MDLLEVQYILLFCVYALKAGPGGCGLIGGTVYTIILCVCLEGGAGRLP